MFILFHIAIFGLINKYFTKTSDDFFADEAPQLFAQKKVELALVDGMHEYAYALRDAENILHYLTDDGVIIMHDCNPKTKEEAGSYAEWKSMGKTGQWNGDVWKTIVHLRSCRDDINVFVLDCDQGLGIVTKGRPENKLKYSLDEINSFTFNDFDANRRQWINLKSPGYIYDYFKLKP